MTALTNPDRAILAAFEREITSDKPADLVILSREDFVSARRAGVDIGERAGREYALRDSGLDTFYARRHGRWHETHGRALAVDKWTWKDGGVKEIACPDAIAAFGRVLAHKEARK